MSVNLGQVAAVLYGTAAPGNTNVIWAKTTTNDPGTWDIIGFYYHDGTDWQAHNGLHIGPAASADLSKLWLKPNGNTFSLNYYDTVSANWLNLLNIPTKLLTANISITDDSFSGNVVSNQSAINYTITLENTIPVGTIFLVERIGTGAVLITVPVGSEINGIDNHTLSIQEQFTSVSVRCYAVGKYIIEGNTL